MTSVRLYADWRISLAQARRLSGLDRFAFEAQLAPRDVALDTVPLHGHRYEHQYAKRPGRESGDARRAAIVPVASFSVIVATGSPEVFAILFILVTDGEPGTGVVLNAILRNRVAQAIGR